jgi:hypothetical protein
MRTFGVVLGSCSATGTGVGVGTCAVAERTATAAEPDPAELATDAVHLQRCVKLSESGEQNSLLLLRINQLSFILVGRTDGPLDVSGMLHAPSGLTPCEALPSAGVCSPGQDSRLRLITPSWQQLQMVDEFMGKHMPVLALTAGNGWRHNEPWSWNAQLTGRALRLHLWQVKWSPHRPCAEVPGSGDDPIASQEDTLVFRDGAAHLLRLRESGTG